MSRVLIDTFTNLWYHRGYPPGGWGPEATKSMPDVTNSELLARLQTIEGHVRGVQRMIEQGEACTDVINQLLGVQRAVQRVGGLLLERHLRTCVAAAMRSDEPGEQQRVVAEIMGLFAATGKM